MRSLRHEPARSKTSTAVWAEDPLTVDVRRAMDDAVAAPRAAGAHVVEQPATIPVDMAVSHNIFQSLVFGAFAVDRSTSLARCRASITRGSASSAKPPTPCDAQSRAWLFADAARHEMRDRWAGCQRVRGAPARHAHPAPPIHNK